MAIASIQPFYLLNRWPEVMLENVWLFNQVSGQGVEVTGGGTQVYVQDEREYVANALDDAVRLATEQLGYFPRPTYVVDEIIPLRVGKPYTAQQVCTRYGYIQSVGTRAVTLITANVDVDYSDELYDDNVDDLASVTVTTAVADSELAVFFRTADGATASADERWRIYPLKVVDNGDGTKTLTGHRALFVQPVVWTQPYETPDYTHRHAAEAGSADDFVQYVDVYRVYTNTSGAISLLSHPRETGDTGIVAASAWVRDGRYGEIMPYTATGQTAPTDPPYAVKVSYLAGYPLENNLMHRRLEEAVIRLASTRLPRVPVLANRALKIWQEDNRTVAPGDLSPSDSPAPFGMSVGAIAAWRVVKSMRLHQYEEAEANA